MIFAHMKTTGQITRIKNGNWQYRLQRRSEDGTRKSISQSGFPTRAKAKEALDDVIEDIKKAAKLPKRDYKNFDDLFDAYLEVIKPTVREQTYFLYERLIRVYLRPEFGKLEISELDTLQIEKFYVRLQAKFTGTFIFKIHTQLKSALKKARLWKWIIDNPMDGIKPPKQVRTPKETLSPEELNLFFAACLSAAVRAQWIFFALTGARPQEVFAARWQDIDFEKGTFKVEQVLVQTKQVKKFDVPKTDKSKRVLPIPAALLLILKKHKVEQNIIRLQMGDKWINNDLIFPTGTGKAQRLSNIGEKVTKIKTDAGIDKHITPHGFRHSFATLARRGGEDLKVISEYLGHSSIKITADIYSHVNLEEKQKMSNSMARIIMQGK